MNQEDLNKYEEKINNLSEEEKIQRDLYLKQLSDGTLQGPPIGKASVDKKWLKNYTDETIMTSVEDISPYNKILNENCKKERLNNIAINFFGFKITYKKMFENIDRAAMYLKSLGVEAGDVVSICLPNIPEAIYFFYAINKLGATANLIDVRFKADRLKESIEEVNSTKVIMFDAIVNEFGKVIENTKVDKIISVSAVDSLPGPIRKSQMKKIGVKCDVKSDKIVNYHEVIKKVKPVKVINESEKVNVPAYEHTGGTTGKSKVVALTKKSFAGIVYGYSNLNVPMNMNPKDVFLNIIPPFLAYGIIASIHLPLAKGMETVLIPVFEEEKFYDQVIDYHATHTNATKSHWAHLKKHVEDLEFRRDHLEQEINKSNEILRGSTTGISDYFKYKINISKMKKALKKVNKELAAADFSSLVTCGIGGDSVGEEFETQMNDFLQKHGCKYKLSKGYGMTEVGSTFTVAPGVDTYGLGSVGIPLPKNEVKIANDNLEEVNYGEQGDLYISGPTMMEGYIGDEKINNETFVNINGKTWIKTGDIAHMSSEGSLYIDGRSKRLIITDGGNKVFPIVIEDVILKHPAVQDVCVVGVPDENRGNIIKAHIILKEKYKDMADDILNQIKDYCKNEIIEQSLPTVYEIDETFPMTNANKVDFKELERIDAENATSERHR